MKMRLDYVSRKMNMIKGGFILVRFVFILALMTVCTSPAFADVRVLFTGSRLDPEFSKVRTAADAAAEAATAKNHRLAVAAVYDVYGEDVLQYLAPLPLEQVVGLVQKHWPKDEVYVIDPETARAFDTGALTTFFRLLLEQTRAERRIERHSHRGLLSVVHDKGKDGAASINDSNSHYLEQALTPATTQPIVLKAQSQLKAKFFRNGIQFHEAEGFGPGRGINIALVNQITGEVECIYDFDTWITPGLGSQYAKQFVTQVLPERIVLLAVADANFLNTVPDAVATFQQKLGTACAGTATFRDTWASISQLGRSLAEQCGTYSSTTGWPDSVAQVTAPAASATDTTAPGGTFTINSGATVSNTNLITLDLSNITDAQSGMMPGGKMRLSNDSTNWSPMIDFASKTNWVLDRGNGTKKVFAQFRDRDGNWSNTLSATIMLEESAPISILPQTFSGAICLSGSNVYSLSAEGKITTSVDWGRHWTKLQTILTAPDGFWDVNAIVCNPLGKVTVIGFDSEKGQLQIASSNSTDAGRTWRASGITKIATRNLSRDPDLLQTCSSSSGSVVFWSEQINGVEQIFALSSSDGITWSSTPIQVTNLSNEDFVSTWTFQSACQGSNVIAAVRGRDGIKIYRSANGGGSFDTTGINVGINPNNFQLASAPDSQQFYLITLGPGSASTFPVTIRRSSDGGATWGLPVLVGNPKNFSASPKIYAAGSGLLYAAWVERVSDSEGDIVRINVSRDGGFTWLSSPVTIGPKNYWFSFMFAEKPNIGGLLLAANDNGAVTLVWSDDRRGLGSGYTVQRFEVDGAGRTVHEDRQTGQADEIYAASSTNFGMAWTVTGPLNERTTEFFNSPESLFVTNNGVSVAVWEGSKLYSDTRFLNGNIGLPLTAFFDESTYRGAETQPISFSLSISNPLSRVTWDFGDGSMTSGESSISHVYKEVGQYVVKATVNDGTNQVVATADVAVTDLVTLTGKLKGGSSKLLLIATSSRQRASSPPVLKIVETGKEMPFDPSSQTYQIRIKTAGLPATITVRSSLGGQAETTWR